MLGLMQDRPLVLPHIFHRAEQLFGHTRILTAEVGRERSMTVAEWARRVRRLATALDDLGLGPEARGLIRDWLACLGRVEGRDFICAA